MKLRYPNFFSVICESARFETQENELVFARGLIDNGCYAEALLILESSKNQNNHLVIQMIERCKIALKIQEQ